METSKQPLENPAAEEASPAGWAVLVVDDPLPKGVTLDELDAAAARLAESRVETCQGSAVLPVRVDDDAAAIGGELRGIANNAERVTVFWLSRRRHPSVAKVLPHLSSTNASGEPAGNSPVWSFVERRTDGRAFADYLNDPAVLWSEKYARAGYFMPRDPDPDVPSSVYLYSDVEAAAQRALDYQQTVVAGMEQPDPDSLADLRRREDERALVKRFLGGSDNAKIGHSERPRYVHIGRGSSFDGVPGNSQVALYEQWGEDTNAAGLVIYVVDPGQLPDGVTRDDVRRCVTQFDDASPARSRHATFLLYTDDRDPVVLADKMSVTLGIENNPPQTVTIFGLTPDVAEPAVERRILENARRYRRAVHTSDPILRQQIDREPLWRLEPLPRDPTLLREVLEDPQQLWQLSPHTQSRPPASLAISPAATRLPR